MARVWLSPVGVGARQNGQSLMPRFSDARMQPLQTFVMQPAHLDHRLLPVQWQRQVADGTFVLLSPRAAFLHQHQLISRGDALLASPYAALSQCPLPLLYESSGSSRSQAPQTIIVP